MTPRDLTDLYVSEVVVLPPQQSHVGMQRRSFGCTKNTAKRSSCGRSQSNIMQKRLNATRPTRAGGVHLWITKTGDKSKRLEMNVMPYLAKLVVALQRHF